VVPRRRGRDARAPAPRRDAEREREAAREAGLRGRAHGGAARLRDLRQRVHAVPARGRRQRMRPARSSRTPRSTTDLSVSSRARSENVLWRSLMSGSYRFDFVDDEDGNETRISALFLDAAQRSGPYSATFGRQPGNTAGVSSRFDGLRLARRIGEQWRSPRAAGFGRDPDLRPHRDAAPALRPEPRRRGPVRTPGPAALLAAAAGQRHDRPHGGRQRAALLRRALLRGHLRRLRRLLRRPQHRASSPGTGRSRARRT